jgi:hypothetical protein
MNNTIKALVEEIAQVKMSAGWKAITSGTLPSDIVKAINSNLQVARAIGSSARFCTIGTQI